MMFSISDIIPNHKKPTICLNMIVKNESKVIIDTLTNLLNNINFDYWVISDTGSNDNTRQIIKDFFYEKCIPGEIFNDEWRDFGYNRSKALQHAYGKTDYLFIFDADDRIEGKLVLPFSNPNNIFLDGYMLKIGKGFEYVRPLLINNKKKWEFKGVLHEFLSNLEPVSSYGKIEGDYHVVSGRSGSRSNNPTKYYDDAIILEKAYEKELLLPNKGLSGRYAFYCARSYKDAGVKYHDKSIEWYKKLLSTKNHWNQELYYAALEIGIMYKDKHDMENAVTYLLKTVEYDSERIEGVSIAIEYFYESSQYLLINALYHKYKDYNNSNINLNDKLFINKHFYNDRIEFFNAITAYNVNDAKTGYLCCKQILKNNKIGSQEINIVINNLWHVPSYKTMLEEDTEETYIGLFYALDNILYIHKDVIHNINIVNLWNFLFIKVEKHFTKINKNLKDNLVNINKMKDKNLNKNNETIMITFTTCKRFDLFTKTLNSILNTWKGLDRIDYWFCVDDNSSKEERGLMKLRYSWIEYYMKTPNEKGHRESMNIIWNKLNEKKPTYWIHMEDDFLFYYPTDYIQKGIDVLKHNNNNNNNNNNNIQQVVYNKNYAETIEYYKSKGDLPINNMNDIVLHDYKPNNNINTYPNSHYWPHYSFRPSMVKTDVILKLGNYNTPNQFFEMDYANKWTNAGYKTAFFDRITHHHIGRLTNEIGNSDVLNAYQLNNEMQFNNNLNESLNKLNKLNNYIKIVNLERRNDRRNTTTTLMKNASITGYNFYKAVDGKELVSTNELKQLFNGNDFGNRRGVIGCALSHLNLWKDLLVDKENEYYIIFEDDLSIPDINNFKIRIDNLKENEVFEKKEMLFLGYHMFQNKRNEVKHIYDSLSDINDISNNNIVSSIKVEKLNNDLYIGGTFAYSINKIGAKKMVDYIEQNGIKHGIDYVMKIVPTIEKYELQPLIILSEWNEDSSKQIDTDIQNSYDSLDFSQTLEDNFEFIPLKDQIGNDMFFKQPSLIEDMTIALNDEKCQGFNTLGFFKHKINISELEQSMYFKEKDGIYIKKTHILKNNIPNIPNIPNIRIKMLSNWCSSKKLCEEWSNMCNNKDGGFKWNKIELTCDDKSIDYYVVINYPQPGSYYDPKKTIVFQMEPWVYDDNKNWGIKTWGDEWSSPDPSKFLKVFTHKTHLNNVQWQIDYPFYSKEVTNGDKKLNKVATICSSKNFDDGHILRNTFIKYYEQHSDKEETLDVFGRENYHNFDSLYKGQVPDDNKYNVYSKYKYALSVENNSEKNYATEKIWEAILCESLCFYWGCPNLHEYIDENAFVKLPIDNKEESFNIIQKAIKEDWWSQRIDAIKKMKQKILNELGFFPVLEKLVNNS